MAWNETSLQKNKLSYLPEGICNLYSADITIKLTENNICPPYPYCYEYIGKQNIKTCESFECHEEYVKINDSCYYKEHLHVFLFRTPSPEYKMQENVYYT